MKASVETVTPEIAQQWLNMHNNNNYRKIKPHVVSRYARDMANGNWEENGEAIIFNGRGDLLDGQHRLMAITQSKVTMNMLVVRGAKSGMLTIDTGAPRTIHDELRRRGCLHVNMLASVVRWKRIYEISDGDPRQISWSRAGATPHELLQTFTADEDGIVYSVNSARRWGGSGLLKNGSGGICHYMFAQAAGADYADRFFKDFHDRIGLAATDPVLVLRKRMESIQTAGSGGGGSPLQIDRQAITILAWNKWIRDEHASHIRWMPRVMKFPTPLGLEA